jgi:hypothetical protein
LQGCSNTPCPPMLNRPVQPSLAAHKFHLEQDYMKRLFTALEGKSAGPSIITKLNAL